MADVYTSSSSELTSDQRPTPYAWFVVGLLCIVALLNYLDRLMITTMRDPIRADLHVTDAKFGLFTSVFLWSYAACSPLGGFLADRFGRRVVILASLLFWSTATVLSALAHTPGQMLAARTLMGVSEACYIPAALALIADYHRGPTRSLATGLHMVGLYIGAALGGFGGYLAQWGGWRFSFRLFGGIGIAYFVVLLLLLRDAPKGEEQHESGPLVKPFQSTFVSVIESLLKVPGFWLMLLLNVLIGIVNWAVYGWLPTFLKDHFKLGSGAAGVSATTYIQVSSFVGVMVAGVIADRWSRRTRRARNLIPGIGYLLAAPCLVVAASTSSLSLAIAGLIVFGLGRGAFDANQMPIVRELVDEDHSATAYGLLNFIGTSAGGVMVYAGGALMDAKVELSHVFQFCGLCLGCGSLILLFLPASRKQAVAFFIAAPGSGSIDLTASDEALANTQKYSS